MVPFLNAGKYWFIAILGLLFPVLFFVMCGFFIGGIITRSKWSLLSLAAILISWQQISVAFSLHTKKSFDISNGANNLRVLSWNVSSWDEPNKEKNGGSSYREAMLLEVEKSQADVLCFQEFLESKNRASFDYNIPIVEKMGYPYHYYVPTENDDKNFAVGIVIFSKYPIANTGIFDFGNRWDVQQLIYADIQYGNQKIRVFTIHLQSVRFGPNEYQTLHEIKQSKKEGFKESKTIISKLKRGYKYRSLQADIVSDFVEKSPYPVILCGDFNDVPNSYTYFKVRGNMQDAFIQKGSGIGRTFRFISPTLRIDYIFADKKFNITQFDRITVPYSDHYGIIADMSL
jgi:endonuclease/exonuclease/phosphatase family metal-dependent hydrolase